MVDLYCEESFENVMFSKVVKTVGKGFFLLLSSSSKEYISPVVAKQKKKTLQKYSRKQNVFICYFAVTLFPIILKMSLLLLNALH